MALNIDSVKHIDAGAEAASVEIGFAHFLISNEGESTLYFCDGARGDASAETGFPLKPGERIDVPMTAETLSISAGGKAAILTFGG